MKITKKFIIYLIVFSLLPIIVLGLISIYFSRDVNLREFRNNSDLILIELSNEIQEYINNNKKILTSITISMLGSKNLETELQKKQALLRRYIFDYDTFLELFIFDDNQKLLTGSNEHFIDSEILIEELQKFTSQDKYIPEIYFTEEGMPYYYDFEYGFLSNGEKYIIGGKVSLISIWTYLHTKKIGKKGLVFLLDKDNTLIAHPKIQKVFQQEKFPVKLTDSNYFYYRNFDNIKCIGLSRRIHSNHIRLVLERPAAEVFTTSRRITLFLIIITLILIILITFISSRIGLIIVNNINNLLGGMKTISSGDLQFRIESKGEEEFREIADGINKMTDEILEMQDELAEKRQLAEIGTLTSKIAHDLRNPLTPIKTFSELLPEKFDDPEFRRKFINIVIPKINYIDEFITNMLEYGKPYKPEFEEIDLIKLLMELKDFLSEEFEKRAIDFKIDSELEQVMINADKEKIFEAFLNLIKNSIEAIKQNNGSIIIGIEADNDKFKIKINDSGEPIPDSIKDNIFKPFFSTKKSGTGLGLPIVRKIIEAHNGSITVGDRNKFIIIMK